MLSQKTKRITLDILILLSIFFLPWWFSGFLIIAGLFIFNRFYEVFVFAILLDTFYAVPREIFNNIPYFYLLATFVLYFVINGFKKRLRI